MQQCGENVVLGGWARMNVPILGKGENKHYSVELKDNSVELSEEGVTLAEMVLETNDLWDENDPWARGYVKSVFVNLHRLSSLNQGLARRIESARFG
ncbi:hypothetical protein Taro_014520 [Colocasia esculenta]|uniref:Uncharacterized protein n=1 Tax=Colocasia esculenta TaxID=4460 RepID=A0A843UM42_COLES|nr:hypothetical protein [Colocasia esculenta]